MVNINRQVPFGCAIMNPFFIGLWVVAAILLAGGAYIVSRRFLSHLIDDDTVDLSSSVIFRLSSLHSLILALIFAQEQVNLSKLNQSIVDESIAVADVFYDLDRFGSSEASALQNEVVSYTQIVVNEEWELLKDNKLSNDAWSSWGQIYEGVLDLQPVSLRQETLREMMLADIDKVSTYRDIRVAAASSEISLLFWFAGVFGFVAVIALYFSFAPTFINLAILGILSAYVGLILVSIYAMNSPFGTGSLARIAPLEALLEEDFSMDMSEPSPAE